MGHKVVDFITISVGLTKEGGVVEILIDKNTTKLKSDSVPIRAFAVAIINTLDKNKEDVAVQDLLQELKIGLTQDPS